MRTPGDPWLCMMLTPERFPFVFSGLTLHTGFTRPVRKDDTPLTPPGKSYLRQYQMNVVEISCY